jgi:hypothetical protein
VGGLTLTADTACKLEDYVRFGLGEGNDWDALSIEMREATIHVYFAGRKDAITDESKP